MNVDFRLDDRHQSGGDNLRRQFELLVHDVFDACSLACLITERILVPKMRFDLALRSAASAGIGLISLDAVLLSIEALVHF